MLSFIAPVQFVPKKNVLVSCVLEKEDLLLYKIENVKSAKRACLKAYPDILKNLSIVTNGLCLQRAPCCVPSPLGSDPRLSGAGRISIVIV